MHRAGQPSILKTIHNIKNTPMQTHLSVLVRSSAPLLVSVKMSSLEPSITLSRSCFSLSLFSYSCTTSTYCVTLRQIESLSPGPSKTANYLWQAFRVRVPTLIWTGSSRHRSLAKPWTSLGHVADHNNVCLSGRICDVILRI